MKKKFIKCFSCCFYLAPTFEVFANKMPPLPKQSDGQPGLPLDDYILQLLFFGVVLGIFFLKRRKSSV